MSESHAKPSPLHPGTVLQDGTVVGEYVGRSAGALNFYGEHPTFGRVVLKVLAPALDAPLDTMRDAVVSLLGLRHAGVQSLIALGKVGPRNYLVFEYVDGQHLTAALSQLAEAGGQVEDEVVLDLLRHATSALEQLHTVTSHGVLTAQNLYLLRDGRLKIAAPGYARLTLCGLGAASEMFATSPYLAPEVRDDPWSSSEASDVYSLGIVALALLAGRHLNRDEVGEVLEAVCAARPSFAPLLRACVVDEPVMRVQSLSELRSMLTPAPADDAPVPEVRAFESLMGGVRLPTPPSLGGVAAAGDGEDERWITSVGGRDFGPYTATAIRAMLTRDEIDEHTTIIDLYSQQSAPLVDVPAFAEFVLDYLPQRARRRIEQAERREAVVKTAKRTGATTVVAGALGTAAAVGLAVYFHVETPALPLQDIVTVYPHTFTMDEPTYVEIQADGALIASLFDFSDPPPGQPASARRRAGGAEQGDDAPGAGEEGEEPSLDDIVVDFDGSRPASKLTSADLNATLAENQSAIQTCFQRELRDNAEFRGVTVRLSIVPDGRTTNVRVDPHGPVSQEGTTCLRRTFRQMRFPTFNDVPMNVSFPFRPQ